LLTVTLLFGAVGYCHAQSASKPWIAVSFAGYDKLVADVAMIGQLGGNANLGKQLEMMALMLPQGEGSKGPLALDTKQPWGAVLVGDVNSPTYYAFIPVSDMKPIVELAKAQLGKEVKSENGVYQFPANGKTVYAVQKGKWAFLADSSDHLNNVVTDPAPLLGDLPTRYDLAIRTSIKSLPAEFRNQLLAQLRAGAEVGMNNLSSAGDEDAAIRTNVAKQSVEQLTTLVNDMDEVLIGWNIDAKSKTTYLDVELTAQTGTKLASQFAEIKPGKTNFAGMLLPNAAVTASSIGATSDAQLAQAKSNLAGLRKTAIKGLESQGLSEEEVKLATTLLADVMDVLEKTLEMKKTDMAMSVVLQPDALTVVGGATIAEGAKLDKTLQQLVAEVKKNEEAANLVKISDETVDGIHLQKVSMPTPDQQLAPLVGDTLEMVVGVADDKVLVAVGRDAAKTLKKTIGQLKTTAGKEVPPLRISVAATSVAKFISEIDGDAQVKATASMVAGMLAKAGQQDHVTVTAQPIAQGVRVRLELEEGLLKAIGSLTQMMGGMAPGQ
jgi:hypothetical protein